MHNKLATATQRQAINCRHGRRHRIFKRLCGNLELLNQMLDCGKPARHQLIRHTQLPCGFQGQRFGFLLERFEQFTHRRRLRRLGAARRRLFQIRTYRERGLGLPHHQTQVFFFGNGDGLLHALEHIVTDSVHAALEADNRDIVTGVPATHGISLENGFAVFAFFAQQLVGKRLAFVDR